MFQQKQDVCRRNTSNEAYYIDFIEGISISRKHGANDIGVFMNSELVCNQRKGAYQVKKEHLISLDREARIIASQFDSFTINHHINNDRMSNDLLSWTIATLVGLRRGPGGFKYDLELSGNCYSSLICLCFLVIFILVPLMVWFLCL